MTTPQEQVTVGNAILVDDDGDFVEGYDNGATYYYDRNFQLPQPFTASNVRDFLINMMKDPSETPAWNAGFVLGWIASLCENNPNNFYTSILVQCETPIPVSVR